MKKFGWPMLYVFLIKPFKQWSFEKTLFFTGQVIPQKIIVFQRKQYKIRFSLVFCFASFDSLKALTGG